MSILPTEYKQKLVGFLKISFFAFVICYFSYHLVSGERGIGTLLKLNNEVSVAREEQKKIAAEKEFMEQKVSKLYPQSLDADLVDEQARKLLGHASKDEIVYIRPTQNKNTSEKAKTK